LSLHYLSFFYFSSQVSSALDRSSEAFAAPTALCSCSSSTYEADMMQKTCKQERFSVLALSWLTSRTSSGAGKIFVTRSLRAQAYFS
jgi:hypothetical protein